MHTFMVLFLETMIFTLRLTAQLAASLLFSRPIGTTAIIIVVRVFGSHQADAAPRAQDTVRDAAPTAGRHNARTTATITQIIDAPILLHNRDALRRVRQFLI
jgi:hypothetical protein